MKGRIHSPTIFLTFFLFAASAQAWLRGPYEDSELVERSELIVVGHLVPESIEFRWHEQRPDQGRSWEYRADLIVREVLKGKLESSVTQIPIILHYGLTPVVGGYSRRGNKWIDHRMPTKRILPKQIEIYDSGSSSVSFEPLVVDAREDGIWCLRRNLRHRDVQRPDDDLLGVRDPEDMQPLALKEYLLAYLSADTEGILRDHWLDHPLAGERARDFLDTAEVERILQVDDPAERAQLLLPIYLREVQRPRRASPARDGLIEAGAAAGRALLRVFDEQADERIRRDILRLWGKIGYRGAVPTLVELLLDHDEFWARQQLPPDWWNENGPQSAERYRRYGEVYAAVYALWQIGDPKATEAVRKTERRWRLISSDDNQIVETCEQALKKFATDA